MSTHAMNSPSSLALRELCPRSALMEYLGTDVPNEDADRGTALHAECSRAIKAGSMEGVSSDARTALEQLNRLAPLNLWESEIRVDVGAALGDASMGVGTIDALYTGVDAKLNQVLIVADFKFGTNPVDVQHNLQLHAYAYAAMAMFRAKKFDITNTAIIQNGVTTIAPFEAEVIDRIKSIVAETRRPEAQYKTGDHCVRCKGQSICAVRTKQITDELGFADESVELIPIENPVAWLAKVKAAKVESHIERIEKETKSRLLAGEEFSEVRLGNPHKFKTIPTENIGALLCVCGPEIYTSPTLKSPATLLKEFPAFREGINGLIVEKQNPNRRSMVWGGKK